MRDVATKTQRDLSRCLLSIMQESMKDGYNAALDVPGGVGSYSRMKEAMHSATSLKVSSMYAKSEVKLLEGIGELVHQIASLVEQTSQIIAKHLGGVYSTYWDSRNGRSKQRKNQKTHYTLLQGINALCTVIANIQALVGIEREALNESDSDLSAEMKYSAENGDDSGYDEVNHRSVKSICVQDAGVDAVNGEYFCFGSIDGVNRYRKIGVWNEQDAKFDLFCCPKMFDETRRWFISIAPHGEWQGTSEFVGFYEAPTSIALSDLPPERGWVTVHNKLGIDPPPRIVWESKSNRDNDEESGNEKSGDEVLMKRNHAMRVTGSFL
uniref:Uncharacterized protein n=1 Tax=Ditylum brightwellii TaxID=49249 RepID=A0A7S1YV72_9STRA|mmetsp:Transcript_18445/g.27520  ORF Transcript_18445/g.27520 Transcript_18445/m.27520 type:complete len:324 (+) Transcript_18445:305-1276(+)